MFWNVEGHFEVEVGKVTLTVDGIDKMSLPEGSRGV